MPYKNPKDPRKLASAKAWRDANAEKLRLYGKEYREGNKEKISEKRKIDYAANKEHENLLSQKWHIANTEKVSARKKAYKAVNKAITNAHAAKRRAAQKVPKWLTEFDKLKIKCIYSVASMLSRENNEPWHVDHIYPLQGKVVSGLHVPLNLQVIPAIENYRKGIKV